MKQAFTAVLNRALSPGLAGAALLDRDGTLVARAGDIDDATLDGIGRLLVRAGESALAPELAARLTAGEVTELTVDDAPVFVSIARMCLFVVSVARVSGYRSETAALVVHRAVDDCVGELLGGRGAALPGTPPGAPSGPASLPLIELGVTPGIGRGKA